jgi:hypothetical protein
MSKDVEKTNAGLEVEGDLEEVADIARKAEEVMKEEEADEKSVEDFNEWRPRETDTEDDLRRKTVEKASVKKKSVEDEAEGIHDLKQAGEKAVEAGKKTAKMQKPDEAKEATEDAFRPFYSLTLKITRLFERSIYSRLMLRFNPYFFDSAQVSADVKSLKEEKYRMQITSTDKKCREALKHELAEED